MKDWEGAEREILMKSWRGRKMINVRHIEGVVAKYVDSSDDDELNDKITARHYCDAGSTGGSSEEILADGI